MRPYISAFDAISSSETKRYNAAAWALARKMFIKEDDGRSWSNGKLARELERAGAKLISEAEKAVYYDRAMQILIDQKLRRCESLLDDASQC